MSFKIGDLVYSVKNDEITDQVGQVTNVTDNEVIVSPVEFPFIEFSYNLKGQHLEDTEFSIIKVKEQ
jgi:hypothetical protein